MNQKISEFLKHQTCSSICCVDAEGKPYSFTIFYAFDIYEGLLYFKSSDNTRHAAILKANPFVSGTILPDKLNHLHVVGIQFEGVIIPANHPLASKATFHYYHKHPFASAMPGEIWTVQINRIKFTDSTIGFSNKIKWLREEELLIHNL